VRAGNCYSFTASVIEKGMLRDERGANQHHRTPMPRQCFWIRPGLPVTWFVVDRGYAFTTAPVGQNIRNHLSVTSQSKKFSADEGRRCTQSTQITPRQMIRQGA
jgi:hypothetical protein